MERYTAFDLELANRFPSSICAIGFCVVENNRVIHTFYTKIRPVPFKVETGNFNVHHITLNALEHAPTFDEVWKEIEPFFNETTIVAHNIQQDALALRETLTSYQIPFPKCKLSCTFTLSRKLILDSPSYKLDGIASYFNLEFSHHHALEDALMCFRIIKKIKQMYKLRYLDHLHQYLHLDYGYMDQHYYKNLFNSDIASDQMWTLEEGDCLKSPIFHQCICLDGIHLPIGELLKLHIRENHGFIQDKVNSHTNYLIVMNRKNSKNLKKAKQLKKKGQDIKILKIKEFLEWISVVEGSII